MTVLFLPDMAAAAGVAGDVRVAYDVGRRVGSAVVRNRVRRRLRAAIRDIDRERGGLSPGAYLVRVGRESAGTPYAVLKRSLGDACAAATGGTDP